jgi:glycosyltransferase involved in cell wall biosynthesis
MHSGRIVFFLHSLAGGGAERVMVTLANSFAQRGYAVSVVLIFPYHTYADELYPTVERVDLHAPRLLVGGLRFARYLRDVKPDAILTTLTRVNGWAIVARLLARSKARLVVREASTPTVAFKRLRTRKERLDHQVVRYLYPKADVIVAPSHGVRKDILQIIPQAEPKIQVIYNPVVDEGLRQKSLEPVTHPWFTDLRVPVVLSVGRLIWDKGFDILLRAFAQVRTTKDARLVILGEGEERASLEKLVDTLHLREWVWMPGFEKNPFKYMRRASVFVLPSRREGLPNALIQAMACGCPIVSTNCPSGPEEILDGGRYGHLVPVDDVDALAQAIVQTLQGDRKEVPPHWLDQFATDHISERYLQVLLG